MMGQSHVRGLLLYGPSGCGKTLIARKLSKALQSRTTEVISGSEIFSRWFGESEERLRSLFADAETEWEEKGAKSVFI
jgi:vesicle-fusing ATPase